MKEGDDEPVARAIEVLELIRHPGELERIGGEI